MRLATIAACAVLSAGCAPGAPARTGGYCAPPADVAVALDEDPPPARSAARDERMAALLGLTAALDQRRRGEPAPLEARVRVLERMERARLAIAATSAELDCEGERAEQAAALLTRTASDRVQALTVGSIAAAAVTAIAGVLLSTRGAPAATQDGVAIGGGGVTAALGLGSLAVHPRVPFAHERNLLADPWRAPAVSSVYPPLVWAYMTRPEFSNEQTQSIREKIVARWRRYHALAEDPSQTALLFGAGGAYDAEALKLRAQMLDEVKAEVELASQDIAALAAVLLR